jgi:type IV pilus assembly protein PilM
VNKFGLTPEEAETAKRMGGLPENYESDVLQPFLDMLSLEVARALQFFYTSTQHNQVDHIVLSGGCGGLPGVADAVAKRVEVHTVIANPFSDMALSAKVKPKNLTQDAPMLMVACGLALRRFDS